MSGGFFDYDQYRINNMADNLEEELNRQGKEKEKDDLYFDIGYYADYPEEMYYPIYPDLVQEKMREAVKHLRLAAIYAQRVDWYLSGDDGAEDFLERLDEELKELEKLNK